jgi:hypothetical protein
MRYAEDYRFCLDCFTRSSADIDAMRAWEQPDEQVGGDDREKLREEAERLMRGGRFNCIVMYGPSQSGDEWDEIECWP